MNEQRRRLLSLPLAFFAVPTLERLSEALPAQAVVNGPAHGLRIPSGRPRLWWTPERLTQARAWYLTHEVPVIRREDPVGYAFRYLMKGDARDARAAIDAVMGLTVRVSGTSSNEARWAGEAAILTFDWAHDQFTPAERATFTERWNGYLEALRHKPWGGPTMPQSNYFWGYLRNEIAWSIATYHENPAAKTLLDFALRTRWQDSFVPHARTVARGGAPLEGGQYGRYLLQYAVVPLTTAQLLGRPMVAETEFFKEAVVRLLYATTPALTVPQAGGAGRWEIFPYGDDQFFQVGGSAEGIEYGTFASAAMALWRDKGIGRLARHWLQTTSAIRPPFVAAVEMPGEPLPPTSLPLDYYAPGPQHLYARTSWRPDATLLHLQLGSVPDGSHEHADNGNWQLWRAGRWLTRETTGYSLEAYQSLAHNCLLVNGKGLADGARNGQAIVRRLESRELYVYAAVNLSPAYRNDQTAARHRTERDNPASAVVEREFVFIRPLETLVIFDRIHSNNRVMQAAGVKKTFLAHFEQAPALKGANEVIGVNGDQVLRLVTLAPAAAVRRLVFEGKPIGQHRLEVETSGSERSYFLHVAQGRGASDPDIVSRVVETALQYTVTLEHPTRGFARLVFQKEPSAPAALQYSRTRMPTSATSLLDRVQTIRVGDDGPAWEKLPENGIGVA